MAEKTARKPNGKLRALRAQQLAKLGWSLVESNKAEEALEPLVMATELAPRNAAYWASLGMAFARLLRPLDAIRCFEQSLALAPKSIEIWCAVGELSLDRLDYRLAAQAFKRCLELDPQAQHPSGVRARALIRRAQKHLAQRSS